MTPPRAEALVASLVGRPVRTYLGREARVARVEGGAVVLVDARGGEAGRIVLEDIQAGLDQLRDEGKVAVTIGALGPGATYVAAILAEVEGAAYDDDPERVVLADPRP